MCRDAGRQGVNALPAGVIHCFAAVQFPGEVPRGGTGQVGFARRPAFL